LTDRKAIARSAAIVLLPALVVAGTLVFLYFSAPMDRPWNATSALTLLAGLLLAGVVVGWQARAVTRSRHPRLRAAVVLALSFPVLILLFASAYFLMSQDDPAAFSEALTRLASLYFTMTVFSTVGFGDIAARTDQARTVVLAQMLLDLGYIGFLGRAVVAAARIGVRRRRGGSADDA